MDEDAAVVLGPSKTITLHPLKAVGNLQERYSEATADVNFVGEERLPAHRAVLSVASAVFFKMFEGDWKESREKNIPAPAEYSWEAFKAAITLLYGVEVEVDESSIRDVYKVAHCYDLGLVKVVLALAIAQWDADMVDTVMKLCALTGHLETEEHQKELELTQTGSAYIVKHLALIKAKPAGLSALPYQTMLKIVQHEDITVPELDVFLLLNQWLDGQLDISLRQARQLYSHIRYGCIPYEFLSLGIIQENLNLTLQNHKQWSVDRIRDNLKLITPRLCQNEVLQVYPLVAGLSVSRKIGKWEFVDVLEPTRYTMGVIFSGRQEFTCRLRLKMLTDETRLFYTELSSLCKESHTTKAAEMKLIERINFGGGNTNLSYMDYTVTLKSAGAFLVRESRQYSNGQVLPDDKRVCKNVDIPFKGPFPWILKIGVPCSQGGFMRSNQAVSMTLHCE